MSDLVATVPMGIWDEWIDEGDAAGDPESGEEWGFFMGSTMRPRPPIEPGDRLYIVSHDRVRGYAPVIRVIAFKGQWAIGRKGGAQAISVPWTVGGFRGWRHRWWERSAEVPFPDWKTAGVFTPAERRALAREEARR